MMVNKCEIEECGHAAEISFKLCGWELRICRTHSKHAFETALQFEKDYTELREKALRRFFGGKE